jgi:hypothetical protein
VHPALSLVCAHQLRSLISICRQLHRDFARRNRTTREVSPLLRKAASYDLKGKGRWSEWVGILCTFRWGASFATLSFLTAALCMVAGCGGGGSTGSTTTTPPPSPDFSLAVSNSRVTVASGSSATASVAVTGSNGFTSPVTIGVTGLPSGVSVSPTSLQVTPGQSGQLTFTSAAYVSATTASLTLTGSSGPLNHKATISLAVTAYAGNIPLPRTRYTRTDATTEYFLYPNSNWIVFNSSTNRFFVTDPGSNRVFALDAAQRTIVGSIVVPGAYGIDETPDHTTLYVGTQVGDIYAIDPVSMTVKKRYMASQIGPNGFMAYSVRVLADGSLALLGGQGGIVGVDGYGQFAVWNPASNSITIFGENVAIPCGQQAGGIFEFSVTGDRSLVLLVIGNGNRVCTIDPHTGAANSFVSENGFGGYPVVATPDGQSILALQWGTIGTGNPPPQVVVLDAKTLAQKSTITLTAESTSTSAMVTSADSKTVYVSEDAWTGIVYAYDIASGQLLGWFSNLFLSPIVGGSASGPIYTPAYQAVDNTGLLAGPMEEGVGFLDTSALQTGPVGPDVLNGYLSPATGSSAGGTTVTLSPYSNLDTIYFGANKAGSTELSAGDLFTTVTPAGPPGPVDVSLLYTNGALQILPDAFSYGPTILEATSNSSTADGGGTGIIYGYGFGPVTNPAQIPSDLQVFVGGKTAQITAFNPSAYGIESPPYPLQSVAYTVPSGTAGAAQDITLSTLSGTTTLSGGMQYLPPLQQFALSGAALAQGIYDPKRDIYYFTDASAIRVFSRSQGQWLASIQVPAAPNGATHRLWGIALSPDGSKLAVSDQSAGSIYVIDPDTHSTVQSFLLSNSLQPSAIAISDTGMIYYATYDPNTTGSPGIFRLDSSNGSIKSYGIYTFPGAQQLRAVLSSDNSTAYFNNDGSVFSIDTQTNTIQYASADPGCCYGDYNLSLSSNQATLEATSYLYDGNLNAQSYLALNDREALDVSYVDGAKLSADGTLLFQPTTNGIDVYDGRLGTYDARIALPVALSQNYDALVSDGKDNILIAITGQNGTGIAIVDLSSLNEPLPLPYFKNRPEMMHTPKLNETHSLEAASSDHTSGEALSHAVPRKVIKYAINAESVRHQ